MVKNPDALGKHYPTPICTLEVRSIIRPACMKVPELICRLPANGHVQV